MATHECPECGSECDCDTGVDVCVHCDDEQDDPWMDDDETRVMDWQDKHRVEF